jgi:DEAD/DEAH box helicase domain-containing protein
MLPLHQSQELTASLKSYFEAAYHFQDREVGEAFHRFVEDDTTGIFKGPYLSVKLPFVTAKTGEHIPLTIQDKYTPYDHQLRAFRRLTTQGGHQPEATIMTTGTGSGKTESFLFPLLDYAYLNRHRPGIKAIIMYPMNALATDQAARFASTIRENPLLKEAGITVGLLIGEGKTEGDKDRPGAMGPDHVIEDKDAILKSPPDILLTNFKMLDYALMRARYQQLWSLNLADTDLLKFLVLDELHTYDGAQGSDVANLIRRLKLKFGLERGRLCPVGTSATVGDGEEGREQLSAYAGRVFGETFGKGAIIGEKRKSVEDFFSNSPAILLPEILEPSALQFQQDDTFNKYVERQKTIWAIPKKSSKAEIGGWLKTSLLFQHIVASCGPAPQDVRELLRELSRREERFNGLGKDVQRMLLFSLLAIADLSQNSSGQALLSIQVQLWIRELSGIVRDIAPTPAFRWRQPGPTREDDGTLALPLWHCRECGGSGWLARKPDNREEFIPDASKVFDAYFSGDKNIWFLNTDVEKHQAVSEYQATESRRGWLDPKTLSWREKQTEGAVAVIGYRKYKGHKSDHSCPLCNNPGNSISAVGGRTATMASVVTGQLLATELDETEEQQRKVLAFTNSVQDAAHQAGFIRARNYRFSFRTALQTVIKRQHKATSLHDLFDKFRLKWESILETRYPDDAEAAYVHQFFPAKKIGKTDPEDFRLDDGTYDKKFIAELDRAINWEATAEFGYGATIGRTLEKTLTCSVTIDGQRVDQVHGLLKAWLDENAMGSVTPAQMRFLVTGLLLRQRQRGAVSHPFLNKYRTKGAIQWNLNYSKDPSHTLNPTYGSRSRYPRPLVTGHLIAKDSPLDTTYTQKTNWYHAWYRRNFPLAASDTEVMNDFYQQLLPALASVGLLDEVKGTEGNNYCIRPEVLFVGAAAGAVECGKCNARQTVDPQNNGLTGMPCTSYQCTGEYQPVDTEANYYQSVYNRRRAPRIYATDHTGLLDRGDRERKEQDFKFRPRVNSLNALVATSTLEMGIDIGDLNVTLNTSVPPLPSNFLQRVGRAGRKSGSALIVNFATARKSHDLFYFEEPLEMMAGKVHTPGCFLSAKEIMKRHFLAFIIDNWTASDPTENRIPPQLGLLKLKPLNLNDPTWFPNRLRTFIREAGEELLTEFQTGYSDDEIDPETFTELASFLKNGYLDQRVERCFTFIVEEVKSLRGHGTYLQEELDSGKYGKTDPLYESYKQEIRSLRAAIRKIEQRQTLEQLTNFGLLPNYAFPETGVTMSAQISTPRRQEDGSVTYDPVVVEAIRPASSGLRDLTPGNLFYTQGWQLPISGINTADFEDTTAHWRFCSNCDHLERSTTTTSGFCPKCNDPSFSTPENRHLLSELREVKASARRDDATIRDNKEERDRGNQLITRHFNFSQSETQGAFALTDIPFGVEYVKRVSMREVNAGHKQHRESGRTVTIFDKDVNAAGYITCKHCGKSTTHRQKETNRAQAKEAPDYHYPYCSRKAHAYAGAEDGILKELFFSREINSEVIKMLLPIQEFEREEHIQMFLAGINLGLKHFYGGNPQHIGLHGYPEFNQRTGRFDVYLILIDTIPGGTGYLGKLFTRDNITRLLRLAYEQIKSCGCQNRGKDGCYHCIFSYGTQHFHHALSRAATEALFKKILDKCGDWIDVPGGLRAVANTSYIEESELESRFVRLFRTLAKRPEKGWSFREHNQEGAMEYSLTYVAGETSYTYSLRAQVNLGYGQGIVLPTRADFVLRLSGGSENGRALSAEEIEARTLVPVFLDGYAWHATREHPRFATDISRRHAVLKSGRYASWTLTFDDVVRAEQSLGLEHKKNKANTWDELAGAYQKKEHQDVVKFVAKSPEKGGDQTAFGQLNGNFGRLHWWLEKGLKRELIEDASHAFLSAFQSDLKKNNYEATAVETVVAGKALRNVFQPLTKLGPDAFAYLDGLPTLPEQAYELNAFTGLLKRKFAYRLSTKPMSGNGDGYDKDAWYYFWRLFNLLQFAGASPPEIQQIGEGAAAYVTLVLQHNDEVSTSQAGSSSSTQRPASLEDVLEYYDAPYHSFIRSALAAGKLEASELDGSFILMSDENEVLAEGVVGSSAARVVAGPLSERDADIFKEFGYTIFAVADLTVELF